MKFSALLGSAIGLERERVSWAAGLRTHMLVCVGSTLIMIVSAYGFSDVLGSHVVVDPSRTAAQEVSGIGFLGAGAILALNEITLILSRVSVKEFDAIQKRLQDAPGLREVKESARPDRPYLPNAVRHAPSPLPWSGRPA